MAELESGGLAGLDDIPLEDVSRYEHDICGDCDLGYVEDATHRLPYIANCSSNVVEMNSMPMLPLSRDR